MTNFYGIFNYKHRSKSPISEIFNQCEMINPVGPFISRELVAYIIVNVKLGTIEFHGGPLDQNQNHTKVYKGTLTITAK